MPLLTTGKAEQQGCLGTGKGPEETARELTCLDGDVTEVSQACLLVPFGCSGCFRFRWFFSTCYGF